MPRDPENDIRLAKLAEEEAELNKEVEYAEQAEAEADNVASLEDEQQAAPGL